MTRKKTKKKKRGKDTGAISVSYLHPQTGGREEMGIEGQLILSHWILSAGTREAEKDMHPLAVWCPSMRPVNTRNPTTPHPSLKCSQ